MQAGRDMTTRMIRENSQQDMTSARKSPKWILLAIAFLIQCVLVVSAPSTSHAQSTVPDLCVEDGGTALCAPPEAFPWSYSATNSNPCLKSGFASEDAAKAFDLSCLSSPPVCTGNIVGIREDWGRNSYHFPEYPETQIKIFDLLQTYYSNEQPACTRSTTIGLQLRRDRYVACPQGYLPNGYTQPAWRYCFKPQTPPSCCDRNTEPDPKVGDPISPSQGANTRVETDYDSSAGSSPLTLQRFYSSYGFFVSRFSNPVGQFGPSWHSNFDRFLSILDGGTTTIAAAQRPNGDVKLFKLIGGVWTSDGDDPAQLAELPSGSGYTLVTADNTVETYNSSRRLVSVSHNGALTLSLSYSDSTTPASIAPQAGLLLTASDAFGHQLSFAYNERGYVSTTTDSSGGVYNYLYDAIGNLLSVVYPVDTALPAQLDPHGC